MRKLLAKVGTYQKDGETKNRWEQLGVIMSNEKGEYALLDPKVSLAGVLACQNAMSDQPRTRIMVSIFDDDNDQQRPAAAPAQKPRPAHAGGDVFDDDIPF